MLWRFQHRPNVTFVGSFHVLPEASSLIRTLIEHTLPTVELLVLEADLRQPLDSWGRLANGTLSALVDPSIWNRLVSLAADLELDPDHLNSLQPWAAAQCISMTLLRQSGARLEYGVEAVLRDAAAAQGKRVLFLEAMDDQRLANEEAPLSEQLAMLSQVLYNPTEPAADFQSVQGAWHRSDVPALEAFFATRTARYPATFERLVAVRNRAWLPSLVGLAGSGYSAIVAVGLLHFLGASGLPVLLREQGQPLQPWRAASHPSLQRR